MEQPHINLLSACHLESSLDDKVPVRRRGEISDHLHQGNNNLVAFMAARCVETINHLLAALRALSKLLRIAHICQKALGWQIRLQPSRLKFVFLHDRGHAFYPRAHSARTRVGVIIDCETHEWNSNFESKDSERTKRK